MNAFPNKSKLLIYNWAIENYKLLVTGTQFYKLLDIETFVAQHEGRQTRMGLEEFKDDQLAIFWGREMEHRVSSRPVVSSPP